MIPLNCGMNTSSSGDRNEIEAQETQEQVETPHGIKRTKDLARAIIRIGGKRLRRGEEKCFEFQVYDYRYGLHSGLRSV
jgi:hypothetical protein